MKNNIILALILCLVSVTFYSCTSNESPKEDNNPKTVLRLGNDQYVTDPNSGLQYNKNSLYAPQIEDNNSHN